MIGVSMGNRSFMVDWTESDDVQRDRYLTCLRVFGHHALTRLDDAFRDHLPDQGLRAGEVLQRFVAEQERRWGADGALGPASRYGGDDGHHVPLLCFGIMVETAQLQVYRIWSRVLLVYA